MQLSPNRIEVMQFLAKNMDDIIDSYLTPVDKIWQPTDFLPDSSSENFFDDVKNLRETNTMYFHLSIRKTTKTMKLSFYKTTHHPNLILENNIIL